MGHNYIGTEHLLLGLLREGEGVASSVLDSFGITLERARAEVVPYSYPGRSANPPGLARRAFHEPAHPALDQLGTDLTEAGAQRQARPGHRPAQGNRARHPDFKPPHQEQSRPHRRTGRRQDRYRRRAGPAHRRRRCAGDADRTSASSPWTWARWWPAPSTAASSKSV